MSRLQASKLKVPTLCSENWKIRKFKIEANFLKSIYGRAPSSPSQVFSRILPSFLRLLNDAFPYSAKLFKEFIFQ